MKRIRVLCAVLTALMFSAFTGGVMAAVIGVAPLVGSVTGMVCTLFVPSMGESVAYEGILKDLWSGEVVKRMRDSLASIGWINKITAYDQYVQAGNEHSVIHLAEIGVDPDVLINNTTYPIPVQNISDTDITISLDKYQTKATPVTDDELYACSIDKMAIRVEAHKEAIVENRLKKAAHALSPSGHTAATPVLVTTGAQSADGTHKMLTRADIIALKSSFDQQRIPSDGRILVLCPDHVSDLLTLDQKFADQYHNYTTGKIANLYGFEVYEYVGCPFYTVSTKAKKAFGSVATGTDRQASFAFYAKDMFKANGDTKMYYSEAKSDPLHQRNLINFRNYFICLPKVQRGIGAIVSAV